MGQYAYLLSTSFWTCIPPFHSLNQTDLGEYVFQYFLCQLVCMFLKKVDAIVFRGSSCERISKIVKTVKMQKSMHENHIWSALNMQLNMACY